MFIQEMPVQRQGSESLSFQSEKAEEEEDWSTADLRESRARPSGEREREGEELMSRWRRRERMIISVFFLFFFLVFTLRS